MNILIFKMFLIIKINTENINLGGYKVKLFLKVEMSFIIKKIYQKYNGIET